MILVILSEQVKRSDGGYINVPYMSDAVLVNLGALMQQWTSDKYLATVRLVKLLNMHVPYNKLMRHFGLNSVHLRVLFHI